MEDIPVSSETSDLLKKATDREIQNQIYLTLRKTEIRIAEGVQHLKVIKTILVIYFCVFLLSTLIGWIVIIAK